MAGLVKYLSQMMESYKEFLPAQQYEKQKNERKQLYAWHQRDRM